VFQGIPCLSKIIASEYTTLILGARSYETSYRRVAAVLGVPEHSEAVVSSLQTRMDEVCARAPKTRDRPRCVLMEWIDPPFCSGHWGPELVAMAGGEEILGRQGEDSRRISWERVLEAQPEVLVLACCGYQ
jgi:iron complex transport system substrate-binding protein